MKGINDLEAQKVQLVQTQSYLDGQLARWNDKAYVLEQARARFGFTAPGETNIIVANIPPDEKPKPDNSPSFLTQIGAKDLPLPMLGDQKEGTSSTPPAPSAPAPNVTPSPSPSSQPQSHPTPAPAPSPSPQPQNPPTPAPAPPSPATHPQNATPPSPAPHHE